MTNTETQTATVKMDAATAIAQLGGNRIFAMAFSARQSVAGEDGLLLKVARGLKATGSASHVHVTLAADDTYTVATMRVTRAGGKTLEKRTGVYADGLRETVERMTGLYLTLGTMGRS